MFAATFPGQGSQKPGMGQALYEQGRRAREIFEAISSATGLDVPRLCFESDEETLRRTENAQIALFTAGVAAFAELSERIAPLTPVAAAGHSVGEYAALAAANILQLEDAARLVQKRGDLMARSGKLRKGTMAAVLGLGREDLERICEASSRADSVAVVANDNCPGQLVISGDVDAVERASDAAREAGAKRVLPLNVSGAFHSPLMEESASAMGMALAGAQFSKGDFSVVSNVTAADVEDEALWPGLLERQLKSPVRWTESMTFLLGKGVRTFVECGTGEVLSGLLKRIDREAVSLSVQDPASIDAAVAQIRGG